MAWSVGESVRLLWSWSWWWGGQPLAPPSLVPQSVGRRVGCLASVAPTVVWSFRALTFAATNSGVFCSWRRLQSASVVVCVCVGGWLASRSGEPPQCGRVSFHFHAFCEVWERQLFPFSKGWGLIGQVHVCRNAHFRERAGIVSNFWNAELTIHSVVVFLEFSSREGEQSLGRLRR